MKKDDIKNALFIIDGSSFLYRAYYAIRPLHTADGRAVHAVYGFCRMIKKLIDRFDPKRMVVVFDSPGKTMRHDLYEGYKEKRQAPPSDLIDQKSLILDFIKSIDLPLLMEQGIEADDLMYSLALKAQKEGIKSVVISSDKDMRQLVDGDMIIFDPFKDVFLDRQVLEEKYGFAVEKIPFYFSLVGDASDSIPGVKGVGDKKATEFAQRFKNLDDLYAHVHEFKGALYKNLTENKDKAYMSHQLFLLRDAPIDMTIAQTCYEVNNWPKARKFFEEFNFKSLLKDLPPSDEEFIPLSERKNLNFITVTTKKQLDELCQLIKKYKLCAIDTETEGLQPLEHELVGISICVKKGTSYYIPFGHKDGEQLCKKEVVSALKPLFEDPAIKKIMHSAKFDWLALYSSGIKVVGLEIDTIVAASLLVLDGQRLSLKSLSEQFLGDKMLSFKALVKKGDFKTFADVPLDLATEYAAADAHQTLLLAYELEKKLKEDKSLYELYKEIEHPVIAILSQMEADGIYLDRGVLAEIDKKVSNDLAMLRATIIDLIGPEYKNINLNSPKQLEELLFKHLKLTPKKKTTGKKAYSTDQEVLNVLAREHPVPGLIVKYRELFKLKSTYIDALPHYVNPKTGRVHTTYNQTQVATGRLSSSDPNLQNIPVNSTLDELSIRAAFKPVQGYTFISADYSQIELRVLAYLSQDEVLLEAFKQGRDIHRQTASRLFDVPLDQVSSEQRQIGKRINFSVLYGLTPFGLARELEIPYKEAQEYIEKYFAQYPGVDQWMDEIVMFAKSHGYVQTHWGRRRYTPGIYERNRNIYEAARRMAINTVAQGTAAEIMKQGMIKLDKTLKKENIEAKIILQIHDELLIAVRDDQVEKSLPIIKKALDEVVDWNVPFEISLRSGKNWPISQVGRPPRRTSEASRDPLVANLAGFDRQAQLQMISMTC